MSFGDTAARGGNGDERARKLLEQNMLVVEYEQQSREAAKGKGQEDSVPS